MLGIERLAKYHTDIFTFASIFGWFIFSVHMGWLRRIFYQSKEKAEEEKVNMECPDCKEVLIWNSDNDTEDADGVECIESFYSCPSCGLFLTIIRKC